MTERKDMDEARGIARDLLGTMTAACIARDCMPGECLQGCVARIDLLADALLAERSKDETP